MHPLKYDSTDFSLGVELGGRDHGTDVLERETFNLT